MFVAVLLSFLMTCLLFLALYKIYTILALSAISSMYWKYEAGYGCYAARLTAVADTFDLVKIIVCIFPHVRAALCVYSCTTNYTVYVDVQ